MGILAKALIIADSAIACVVNDRRIPSGCRCRRDNDASGS
jgi:hypothetical protein